MCTQMGSLPFYIYSYTPLNFANFDLNFKIVFEPHVHTNGKPVFFRQVVVAFVFFRIVVLVISVGQKEKEKKAGFPSVDA